YPSIVHGIAALDLILCRNVMIYFDWDVIQRILGRFHECLVDGGWLAVGHAESNTEMFRAYRTMNVPGATLYQRSGDRPLPSPRRVARARSAQPRGSFLSSADSGTAQASYRRRAGAPAGLVPRSHVRAGALPPGVAAQTNGAP